MFGVKVMLDKDTAPTFDAVRRAFPDLRFVYLTRRDKVRQAVSFRRAQLSGSWVRYRSEVPTTPPVEDAEFNFATLNHWVHKLMMREARWQRFFDALATAPHTVVYEDYARAPERAVRGILDFLGLEPAPDWSLPELPHERLADEVSDVWVERYYKHSTAVGQANSDA